MTDLQTTRISSEFEGPLNALSELPHPTYALWEKAAAKALGSPDLSKLTTITRDGVVIQALTLPDATPRALASRPAGQAWGVVQRVDQVDPAAANASVLEDLAGGATALDLTVYSGNERDLTSCFEGVFLSYIALHLSLGPATYSTLDALQKIALGQVADLGLITVHAGVDPIIEALRSDDLNSAYSIEFAKVFSGLSRGFSGTLLSFRGQEWHASGATDAQETAIALGAFVEALRAAEAQGIDLKTVSEKFEFRLVADAGQFTAIAKFRAFRLLHALILKSCGLSAHPAFVHGETSWRMMSKRDPWVNSLRTTVATVAAGIGGCNSVTVSPHSGLLGVPNRDARRLARNIQIVLLEESNLAVVADPSAGSASIEALTDDFAAKAWELFQEIETEGGLLQSIRAGQITQRVAAARDARAKDVARRREKITGTSMYPLLDEALPDVLGPLPAKEPSPLHKLLPQHRSSEPWEALRDRADATIAAGHAAPSLFLANLGVVASFTLRSTWMKNLVEAGGIVAANQPGFHDANALAQSFKASGAKIAVICSNDATYATHAAEAARALKQAGAQHVALAGRPGDLEATLRDAGVDRFIYDGQDMLAVLADLHAVLGTLFL